MKQLNLILFSIIIPFIGSNDYSWFELVQLEKKGYSITLDSTPIKLCFTYLNKDNVSEIKKNRKTKVINIIRKNKNSTFYSLKDLIARKDYPSEMEYVTVDGKVLDSLEITETKFESEAIKGMRFLTKEMYNGKEFDDLPQVKVAVGKGILMIVTE